MFLINYLFKKRDENMARYRQEHEFFCVDIIINNVLQLFDRIDPSPFREKDLDDDFVKYLILCMRELYNIANVKLVIKMTEQSVHHLSGKDIEQAIRNFFSFEIETAENELRVLFQKGRWSLLMGMGFLLFCHLASYLLESHDPSVWINALREGITVMGWVALWHPLNIFLYEWFPFAEKIKVYERLQRLKVEIVVG